MREREEDVWAFHESLWAEIRERERGDRRGVRGRM